MLRMRGVRAYYTLKARFLERCKIQWLSKTGLLIEKCFDSHCERLIALYGIPEVENVRKIIFRKPQNIEVLLLAANQW